MFIGHTEIVKNEISMKKIVFKVETVKELPNYLYFSQDIEEMVEKNVEICVEISDTEKVVNIRCKDGETVYINDDTIDIKDEKRWIVNQQCYKYDCLTIAFDVLHIIYRKYY